MRTRGRERRIGRGLVSISAITDINPPTVVSCTVAADGVTVTMVFSEAVENVHEDPSPDQTGFVWQHETGGIPDLALLEYASGNGSNTIVFTANATISAPTGNGDFLSYETGNSDSDVTDLAGNLLADFSSFVCINNSTQ